MGRTNTKKIEARNARLKALPQSQRLLKTALIKKKENRILDSAEKHALKMSSEHGEMLRLWEELRTLGSEEKEPNDTGAEDEPKMADKKSAYEHKYATVQKLITLMEPKIATLIKTPSGSRVLQSMIKYGSPQHLSKIMKWLSADFSLYSSDAYAHFVVLAIVRHAPHDVFKSLLASLIPNVPHLISHKFGIASLNSAYCSKWCGKLDKQLLLLSVLKESVSVMKRWKGYPVLEDVLHENPQHRKRLLTHLFDLCDKLVSQKDAIHYPFVQKLVFAYVKNGTRDEVSELCDTLRPHLASIALTQEGAPLASMAFSLTEPKKRKEILRSFKEKLGEISTSKYGAPVIARLYDLLYDPQLSEKYLYVDMVEHIGQLFNSPYGYLIIMHLLTPAQERKDKFLLPNWSEHNLYSKENKKWNHHTWLTADYEEETVEICSKPASKSHMIALPHLVRAAIKYLSDETKKEKINKHHALLISREILHLEESEPLYRAALGLTASDKVVLKSFIPVKEKNLSSESVKQDKTENTKDLKTKKRLRSSSSADSKTEKKKPLKKKKSA